MIVDSRQIISAEMHYPRIPRPYWSQRLQMARAMGCNATSTYVFWNLHEPRPNECDFSGALDVAAYIRAAQSAGLDVILRPGPYVCAECDFGGLPAWLLADEAVPIRTRDERFMQPAKRWLHRLGQELAPLTVSCGGPIVTVQLENEYGAFGNDRGYLEALRTVLDESGFASLPYFTIDQPHDLENGALPGVAAAVTFAPGQRSKAFDALRTLRPEQTLACGEYWAGWFDHWGEPHESRDDAVQAGDVAWMAANGVSMNVYMFHGGTNFGFFNGANTTPTGVYQPTTTSYDYLAALDEAGRPAKKYYAFRDAIAKTAGKPPPVPPVPETVEIPRFALNRSASMYALLRDGVRSQCPRSMEDLGYAFGFVLYRTKLEAAKSAILDLGDVRDYVTISIDGVQIGHLDRRLNQASIELGALEKASMLELLVENCGRVNYGPALPTERKGIVRPVRLNGAELRDWEMFALPLDDLSALTFDDVPRAGPAFFRGTVTIEEPGDTFLDVRTLQKGVLFVNGHNAGRYWDLGPQKSLYVPGVWLVSGTNEIIAFDVMASGELFIEGVREPIIEI